MAEERRFVGVAASPGFARGRLWRLGQAPKAAGRRSAGSADDERTALADALATAASELAALCVSLDDAEAETIVEFQIAMLEDETTAEGAYAAIASGAPADAAWRQAMGATIEDYTASDDAYFRARAGDLADMRDRVLTALTGVAAAPIPPGCIAFGPDISPTRFLATDWNGGGLALAEGSAVSHVAILARARGVPVVVGVDADAALNGADALLDAGTGALIVDPEPETVADFTARAKAADETAAAERAYLDRPALTRAGQRVQVCINIASAADLAALDPAWCDGIGLFRTEFLFGGKAGLPDEDAQTEEYRRVVEWAAGRPVTIRTLDAGGDKPIAGVTVDGESNPFLGVRGVRLSLPNLGLFETQLRALARASAAGPVKVMIPMVSVPDEMAACRAALERARADVGEAGHAVGDVQLGMMVEVPSAALTIEDFDADFYSIGSNDLTQYVMAAGRDNPALAEIARADARAVVGLIAHVAAFGAATGREVSICGDMAGDPELVPTLLDSGLRAVSVSPSALAATKAAIARFAGNGDG